MLHFLIENHVHVGRFFDEVLFLQVLVSGKITMLVPVEADQAVLVSLHLIRVEDDR